MLVRLENGFKLSNGFAFDAEYTIVNDPPRHIATMAECLKSRDEPVFTELWTCQCHTGDPPGHETDKHAIPGCEGEPEVVKFLVDEEYLPLHKPVHLRDYYKHKLTADRLGLFYGLDIAPSSNEPLSVPAPVVVWEEPPHFDKALLYCIENCRGNWTKVVNTDGHVARLYAIHKKDMLTPGNFVYSREVKSAPPDLVKKHIDERCKKMLAINAVGHRLARFRCTYKRLEHHIPTALQWAMIVDTASLVLPEQMYFDAFCAMHLVWKDRPVMCVVENNQLALEFVTLAQKRQMGALVYCLWFDGSLSWVFADNDIVTISEHLPSSQAHRCEGTMFYPCDDSDSDSMFSAFCDKFVVNSPDDTLTVLSHSKKDRAVVVNLQDHTGMKTKVNLVQRAAAIWHGFDGMSNILFQGEPVDDGNSIHATYAGDIYFNR